MLKRRAILAACFAGFLAAISCSPAQEMITPTPEAPAGSTPVAPAPAPDGPSTPAMPTPTPDLGQASGPEPTFEADDCAFERPLGITVECGYLTVPSHRDGRVTTDVRLHVAIIPSDSPDAQPDPVVYLAGGPGEKALQSLEFLFGPLQDLAVDRDLIVFDQRGAGFSEPNLDCQETIDLTYETLDVVLDDVEAERLWLEALTACRNRLIAEGADLSAFSTRENAADVRDLRTALGYDEWNLFGVSYGTRLALTVLRDHPEGIRSVILDSAYPLDVNLYESIAGNTDRVFSVLAEACAADPECSDAYPNLEEQIRSAYERLEENPAPGVITHPLTRETFDAMVDGDAFINHLFLGLYSTEIIPMLPEMISDASSGEVGLVTALGGISLLNLEYISSGMQTSVQCQEDIAATTIEALRASLEDYPGVRPYFEGIADYGTSLIQRCEMWGVMDEHESLEEPGGIDVPTLVLAGEFDPITPPEWGRRAADALDQSTYLEFPGLGHGAIGNECARGIMRQFLADPSVALDHACIDDLEPPAFVLPLERTEMVPFEDATANLAGVRPARWQEIDSGIFLRSGLGEIGLILQALPSGAADQFVSLMLSQLGVEGPAEPLGSRAVNELEWTYYEAGSDGTSVFVATTQAPGADLAVVAAGLEDKAEALREHIFFPAMEALTLLE